MTVSFGNGLISISTNDSDLGWNTQLAPHCADMSQYINAYLHISYSGSNKFSVALQQHNPTCNESISPYPETWDSLEAARYSSEKDIYMPMSHFKVNHTRVIGFNLRGFYTTQATKISKIEIVDALPAGWKVPDKLPRGGSSSPAPGRTRSLSPLTTASPSTRSRSWIPSSKPASR